MPRRWWYATCSMRVFQAAQPSSQVYWKSQHSGHWTDFGGSSARKCERQCIFHSSWSWEMYEHLRNQKEHLYTGGRIWLGCLNSTPLTSSSRGIPECRLASPKLGDVSVSVPSKLLQDIRKRRNFRKSLRLPVASHFRFNGRSGLNVGLDCDSVFCRSSGISLLVPLS